MDVVSRRLGWWLPCLHLLLLACSPVVESTSATLPQTVEVDLIFPRNGTFSPAPFTPVVFAVQNSHHAKPLNLAIYWQLWPPPWNNNSYDGLLSLENENWTSSDPHLVVDITNKANTEGTWRFDWDLSADNCTKIIVEGVESMPTLRSGHFRSLYFTTKNGSPQPDLVAATQQGSCNKTVGIALEIIDMVNISYGNQCPSLLPTSPTLNPCAATVDEAAAASIASSIRRQECFVESSGACPTDQGSGAGLVLPFSISGGVACMAGTLLWLVWVV